MIAMLSTPETPGPPQRPGPNIATRLNPCSLLDVGFLSDREIPMTSNLVDKEDG